jgi:hypothetical protein
VVGGVANRKKKEKKGPTPPSCVCCESGCRMLVVLCDMAAAEVTVEGMKLAVAIAV